MKKILSVLIIFFFPCTVEAQLKSSTSEIFELSSIAFRLAGAEEYMQCPLISYANDIDRYFAPYADHELIGYIREIREKHLIGYDAVANAAAQLVLHGSVMEKTPDAIRLHNPRITISPAFVPSRISNLDERWTAEVYERYVELLDDFYRESKFDKFYADHRKLYQIAVKRMDELLGDMNPKWFGSFFGEDLGDVRIVVSLCNGNCNYAFSRPEESGFGIVVGCRADSKGQPTYSLLMPHTLIHELLHDFTNRLIDGIWDEIEPAALIIYPHVEERMLENAIGFPKNVVTEWFTDLCADMYFRENTKIKAMSPAFMVALQQNRGFIWMERSVDFMEGFYENRASYPTIREYMPQIARFIHETAEDFEQVIVEFDNRNPRVVETFPRQQDTVELDTDRIVIKFSEPMATNSYGYRWIDEEGVLPIPIPKGDKEYWQDDRTFVLPMKKRKLQPNRKYGLILNRFFFSSKRVYPLAEEFTLYFNTKEQ